MRVRGGTSEKVVHGRPRIKERAAAIKRGIFPTTKKKEQSRNDKNGGWVGKKKKKKEEWRRGGRSLKKQRKKINVKVVISELDSVELDGQRAGGVKHISVIAES